MRAGWRVLRKQGESARGERSRFRVRPIALGILGALASVNSLASQEPQSRGDSPTDPGFVFHQTVRRVRVDVTVTDGQGRPVPGLQASDFRLSEDGKPQSIRQFEWHGAETKQAPALTRLAMPPHTFMNLPEQPEHGPLTVLLYDVLNTPLDAQPYAHQQMVKFLKQSTGQPIALFVLSDRLHLLQGFTSNSELIQRAASDSSTPALGGHGSHGDRNSGRCGGRRGESSRSERGCCQSARRFSGPSWRHARPDAADGGA
jgi:hypothetical protein